MMSNSQLYTDYSDNIVTCICITFPAVVWEWPLCSFEGHCENKHVTIHCQYGYFNILHFLSACIDCVLVQTPAEAEDTRW